ncbi:RNA polymerase subunit sigma-70 [Streptomyces sp. NPDC094149]|uniref:RNA polymerase subunit sigma-70 n=1 Tax=Streptomyces sp. NPDC094149 TaxID=3155079 RepID=UPI00331EB375
MPTDDFTALAASYRHELLAHCYRMLGSVHDAEDLVQETLLRGWRGYDRFDGRSSLRTWLYRIATNACLSELAGTHRRVLPSGLGTAAEDGGADLVHADEVAWLTPLPTPGRTAHAQDPSEVTVLRASTRLALVAAFQRLPARQRAALLLVDVVGFRIAEAAEFLGTSVNACRSLLQRARAALAADPPAEDDIRPDPEVDEEVLRRYLEAFEAADTRRLAELLRSGVTYEMPPIATWFRGREAVCDHWTRRVFSKPRRALPLWANGCPAMAVYMEDAGGDMRAHAIEVLETQGGQVSRVVVFLRPELFPHFGVPDVLRGASV